MCGCVSWGGGVVELGERLVNQFEWWMDVWCREWKGVVFVGGRDCGGLHDVVRIVVSDGWIGRFVWL